MSQDKPTRNIKQEKAIANFEKLGVMDMMQTLEDMKIILYEKIEGKKKEVADLHQQYLQMQEKIKAQ